MIVLIVGYHGNGFLKMVNFVIIDPFFQYLLYILGLFLIGFWKYILQPVESCENNNFEETFILGQPIPILPPSIQIQGVPKKGYM